MASGEHRVVVVGGSFGGVNAAYQLRRKLGDRADVTLISAEADFIFIPSLPSSAAKTSAGKRRAR